ncbi:hypothetical protein IFM89_002978 [Coptis chinensis]|uniref:Uncharacterized protein n=1 Tax=Coptis chinensis TaxID=261450 RepID=A0A835M463_9MAGN|nr:hypothetical protein IFM89_002978 [Coptis chinensis]
MAPTTLFLAVFSLVFGSLIINGACAYSTDPKVVDLQGKPKVEISILGHKIIPSSEKPKVPGSLGQKLKPTIKKPKVEQKEKYKKIGIQGIIYCQSGAELVPIKGAVARVTCLAMDKNGYKYAPFSISSKATDAKGYFLATLPISELQSKLKLYTCKAYLASSPMKECNVPTNVNMGSSGALPYSSNRLLTNKKMKLYSVGPFVYRPTKPKLIGGVY